MYYRIGIPIFLFYDSISAIFAKYLSNICLKQTQMCLSTLAFQYMHFSNCVLGYLCPAFVDSRSPWGVCMLHRDALGNKIRSVQSAFRLNLRIVTEVAPENALPLQAKEEAPIRI